MSTTTVTVIGDATLDVTVHPTQPPLAGGDVPARISLAPGGQGANVAVRLARAGVSVKLATSLADDAPGRMLASSLEADGVALARQVGERTGVVTVLVDADGERSMFSDRLSLDSHALAAASRGAGWVHCSGYPLADDEGGDELADLLGSLSGTTRVSVGGGSLQPDPDRAARVRVRLKTSRARLLIVSREEAAALLNAPVPSLPAAADATASAFPSLVAVVTDGAAGSAAAGPGFALSVAAHDPATPMVDATGAGDAYAAGLIAALLDADWPPGVPILRAAMEAGARLGALASRVVGAQGRIAGEEKAAR